MTSEELPCLGIVGNRGVAHVHHGILGGVLKVGLCACNLRIIYSCGSAGGRVDHTG